MKLPFSKDYLYPIGAAMCYGTSAVLIREGMTAKMAPPLVGATVALFWGTLALLPQTILNMKSFRHTNRKGYALFLLAGVAASMGMMSNFFGLSMAPVVVVTPLTSINPLVTIVLAGVFLKRLEKVTLRIVMGAALVVAGVIVITVDTALR